MLWSPTRRWRSPGATSPRKGWSSSRSARSDICCSSRSQSDDDDQRADLFIRPWYGLSRFGIALRHGAGARTGAWELEELAQQTRRYRRYRIVPQYGCVRRTNYFVSNPGQALVAAAKEQSDNRNLPEHVVEAVERNESATHANIAAHIIDVSVNGSADDRPFTRPSRMTKRPSERVKSTRKCENSTPGGGAPAFCGAGTAATRSSAASP